MSVPKRHNTVERFVRLVDLVENGGAVVDHQQKHRHEEKVEVETEYSYNE